MQLRRFWSDGRHLPGIPVDEIPDLNSCLLHQQLQVINCCLSRKRRCTVANESFDSEMREASSNVEELDVSIGGAAASSALYARVNTGELVLRLGANQVTEMTMLESDEPIYLPITQVGCEILPIFYLPFWSIPMIQCLYYLSVGRTFAYRRSY